MRVCWPASTTSFTVGLQTATDEKTADTRNNKVIDESRVMNGGISTRGLQQQQPPTGVLIFHPFLSSDARSSSVRLP
jgi:hypothetical protein